MFCTNFNLDGIIKLFLLLRSFESQYGDLLETNLIKN